MQEIGHEIFIETTFPGVTLGAIVLPHGTILIDAPLRIEDIRSWKASLANLGSSLNRLLVNLDAHPDRTLGAKAMECTIIAHQKTAQVFRSRPSVFKGQSTESGSDWETYNDAVGTRWASPDITFTQCVSLHWGPSDVILESHPGPSYGAIWAILPEAKILFVGDMILSNQPPFLANADIPAWIESIEHLKSSYKGFSVISGRTGILEPEATQAQMKFLKNVMKGMERLSKRNAPLESVENLIPGLLAGISFPKSLKDQYSQRLRHGLFHYYSRHYRPTEFPLQNKQGENDQ